MKQIDLNNEIVIYQSEDGKTQLDVKLEGETVWLNTKQMAVLFDKEESNIRRHITNVFKEGELDRENNVHFLHVNGVKKPVPYYTLDVIISVGYRVHSQRGVRFRQWANSVLKQYLIKGYAVNERIRKQQISELRQLVQVLGRTLQQQPVPTTDESNALFKVVVDYTYALNAMKEINVLKEKFGYSPLFGNEKDESFKSSIGQIYQTFGGVDLYPSVEEKAAMLLYLVTKNHSFSDGNKRIAATLFLWFMNVFVKPDEQSQACLNSAMARKGARKRTTTASFTVRTAPSASPTAP